MKISKWDIFKTFFIIGLTTFGGGYAMLGVMRHKLVEHKKWLTEDEIIELLAVSESTPGPFAVNAATFIGYRKGKFLGSFSSVRCNFTFTNNKRDYRCFIHTIWRDKTR